MLLARGAKKRRCWRCLHLTSVMLAWLLMPGVSWYAVFAKTSGAKRNHISEIIIHATGGPSCIKGKVVFSDPGTLARMTRFFRNSRRVSIHYIIGRNGKIVKGLDERRIAIHARGHNRQSIGIELINEGDGRVPFPEAQMAALVALVHDIRNRYRITLDRILRHSDVDHTTFWCGGKKIRRKQDPGPAFDWKRFQFELLLAGS